MHDYYWCMITTDARHHYAAALLMSLLWSGLWLLLIVIGRGCVR